MLSGVSFIEGIVVLGWVVVLLLTLLRGAVITLDSMLRDREC